MPARSPWTCWSPASWGGSLVSKGRSWQHRKWPAWRPIDSRSVRGLASWRKETGSVLPYRWAALEVVTAQRTAERRPAFLAPVGDEAVSSQHLLRARVSQQRPRDRRGDVQIEHVTPDAVLFALEEGEEHVGIAPMRGVQRVIGPLPDDATSLRVIDPGLALRPPEELCVLRSDLRPETHRLRERTARRLDPALPVFQVEVGQDRITKRRVDFAHAVSHLLDERRTVQASADRPDLPQEVGDERLELHEFPGGDQGVLVAPEKEQELRVVLAHIGVGRIGLNRALI